MGVLKTLLLVIVPLAFICYLVQSDQMPYLDFASAMFQVIEEVVDASLPQQIDCDGACAARCQLSSRPHLCKRACGTCCARCNCVPPGTSGNYDACPCYANMTTHGGRHKCP
ncbi:gibberellin-regulated protein 11 isoform X1 [Manihot esculenta]|uniref:Uncharacterized protein n=1 Tax=Manihot esculenta TaxID=3983 RepID=A0ACB7FWG3_MANES|nr:gibberellin-regulated protein 11 isoform X1 [Manihot esculenta]KAG8632344.1 hypothetical protein MANES_18G013700v8 [Manihot esculenta]